MNFKQFGSLLPDNPLCGIGTYKDELNLATGACTRQIKKLVLTGQENITSGHLERSLFNITVSGYLKTAIITVVCSHYNPQANVSEWGLVLDKRTAFHTGVLSTLLYIRDSTYSTVDDFKIYLQQQYAAGTPVTIWYILATPTTEIITVPSGLSGTEVGYLNQSGTPTPTNPIYPAANEVKVWHDIPHYIHNTATDTITTLPAVLYPNAVTATVGLKGQMEQSGTPSPSSPIQPSECGERTRNLFDGTLIGGIFQDVNFTVSGSTTVYKSIKIYLTAGNYTLSWVKNVNIVRLIIDGTYTENVETDVMTYTFTINNSSYFGVTFRDSTSSSTVWDDSPIMLNTGSTPLPYENFGYKIPILNNSQTTNVYLGETQSTRRIKKLVLTGEENFVKVSNRNVYYLDGLSAILTKYVVTVECSHYVGIGNVDAAGNMVDNSIAFRYSEQRLYIRDDSISTQESFATFLAQQYAAGTPVTVWYVLATPTTGIVNEPLRKIGDYVDEVSGISIPVTAGTNAIDVLTTLKPSEASVNYHGWHPVQSVHERENGAWD